MQPWHWLEPAVLEQGASELESVRMGGVRNPGTDPSLDVDLRREAGAPAVAQPPQPAAESQDIVLRQPATSATGLDAGIAARSCMQLEAKEGGRLCAVSRTIVLRGCSLSRRPSKYRSIRARHTASTAGSSWNSAKSST
jgi:hypothetical protein